MGEALIVRFAMLPSLREIVHPSLLAPRVSPNKLQHHPFHTLQPIRVLSSFRPDPSPMLSPTDGLPLSKRCSIPNCNKRARVFGKCCAHGGKHICTHPGCNKCARAGGRCIKHGGGIRCWVDGCNKAVQSGGVCYAHREFRRAKARDQQEEDQY